MVGGECCSPDNDRSYSGPRVGIKNVVMRKEKRREWKKRRIERIRNEANGQRREGRGTSMKSVPIFTLQTNHCCAVKPSFIILNTSNKFYYIETSRQNGPSSRTKSGPGPQPQFVKKILIIE